MKQAIVLLSIFILAQAQRPPYAGNAKPYPAVLPQYVDEQAAAAAAAAAAAGTAATAAAAPAAGTGAVGDIANRIDSSSTTFTTSPTASTTTTQIIPSDLPVDALGDINLINKIKTWPREKQPFWFINWQQIQEHRGDTTNRRPPEMRSG